MYRCLTALLITLALVANLGAMIPVHAHPAVATAIILDRAAGVAMPGMTMLAVQTGDRTQHRGGQDHPGQKQMDGCTDCAMCAGAKLPDPITYSRPVRFAQLQRVVLLSDLLIVQSATGQIERPPKAKG